MFYAIHNNYMLHQTVIPFEPWTFVPEIQVSEQIRQDKQSRQEFYLNTGTKWNFYTPFEGSNPNQRVSNKDNPPRMQGGFMSDFDMPIPMLTVQEFVKKVPIKPSWICTSLGGKIHLIWQFDKQLRVDSTELAIFILRKAMKWLCLGSLPGLDEKAFLDPAHFQANGAQWVPTGHGHIDSNKLQAFFVEACREFRFKSNDPTEVPLDVVEKKCKELYPATFAWPSEFTEGSQGPSFWIPGSTSPLSAIVKKDGIVSFAQHADKTFYSYGDILGNDFVKQYATDTIAKATKDIYYDKKHYWRMFDNGKWDSVSPTDMQLYLDTDCGLSTKPDKSGKVPVRMALSHIQNKGRVIGGAPFIFQRPGLIEYQGNPIINTYQCKAVRPASEPAIWGPNGNMPWCSLVLDHLFDPAFQKIFVLAWLKRRYESAINFLPRSCTHIFLLGPTGMGKTLFSRKIAGGLLGGFVDASKILLENLNFTSEFYEKPLWCVDDDSSNDNPISHMRFQTMWKKTSANKEFFYHKKFEVPLTILYPAAILCSLNPDAISIRTMGPMDNSSEDKTNVIRCAPESRRLIFPPDEILEAEIARELPYLGRYLLDMIVPEIAGGGDKHIIENDQVVHVARVSRFGYRPYHEPTMFDRARQSSKASPFKALLIESLRFYFQREATATEWCGSVPALIRELQNSNPGNESVLRLLRLEQTEGYLEKIQREGLVKCYTKTGEANTRLWVFPRFEDMPIATPPPVPSQSEIK